MEHLETNQQIVSQSEATIANLDEEIRHLESHLEDPTTDLADFIELPFITYNGVALSNNQREKIRLMLEVLLTNQEREEY